MKRKIILSLLISIISPVSQAQISSANVYWVGHSLISHTYTYNPSSVNLMSLMDTMATSQSKSYSFYDHTIPGAPIGWNWGHSPDSWLSGTETLIQPLINSSHPDYGSYDVIVLTEGVDVNNTYTYWASSFYARKFYNAAKAANDDTRLFLYESWHHYNASDPVFRPEYGPMSTFDWDLYMENARVTWDSIATRAADPDLTQTDADYTFQGEGDDPGLSPNLLDIKIIPTGTVFRAVLARLDSNLVTDDWSYEGGTLADIDFFQNPLANYPEDTVTVVHPADPIDDIHPSDVLIYLNSLVHYAVIYQDNPVDLPAANGVPNNIASIFKEVAWRVVSNDPKTGLGGTGSIKEKNESTVSIFPNPTTDKLTINFSENTDNVSLSILNALGQEVYQNQNMSVSSLDIDVQELNPGIYYVIIRNEGGRIVRKLIKQ